MPFWHFLWHFVENRPHKRCRFGNFYGSGDNKVNTHLPNIYFNKYKCYHVRVNALKSNERKTMNVTLYYFSKSSTPPQLLSTKLQWQDIYTHFKILRSNYPRTPLKEVSQNKEKKKVRKSRSTIKRKINFWRNRRLF